MRNLELKDTIPFLTISVFLTLIINEIICSFFDYSRMMPNIMYAFTVILEASILFFVAKKLLNQWNVNDKYILSLLYFSFILLILLARYGYTYNVVQLNPFACLREFYYGSYYERMIFLFNIISFIPIPVFFEVFLRDIRKSIGSALLFGIGIEVIQLITCKGIFDLGDISLYCVGIFIGSIYLKKGLLRKS